MGIGDRSGVITSKRGEWCHSGAMESILKKSIKHVGKDQTEVFFSAHSGQPFFFSPLLKNAMLSRKKNVNRPFPEMMSY